jgi:hypothetical protein
VDSRNSGDAPHRIDPTRLFFRCLFDSRACKLWHCRHDSHFSAKLRNAQIFLNCGGTSVRVHSLSVLSVFLQRVKIATRPTYLSGVIHFGKVQIGINAALGALR